MSERDDREGGQASGGRADAAIDTALQSDRSLSALQRILLTTDGTVVQLLEAWFDDPISLAGHQQFTTPVGPTDGDLEPMEGETVLRRRVLLRGSRTQRNYVYADTAIVLDRLEATLRDALLSTSEPIGRLLQTYRIETMREVLHTGRRPAAALAAAFGIDSADELLFRVYRVVSGGRPIMLIAEHFPAAPLLEPDAGGPLTVVDLRSDTADAPQAQTCGTC